MNTINTQAIETTQILHTGQQEYWDLVKERTRMRNAVSAFKRLSGNLKVSQIYEVYVCDLNELIYDAAHEVGITDNDEFFRFKLKCAEIAKMPELNKPYCILWEERTEAIDEAVSAMS
ncbi:hypothetical protein [Halocynthiibacter sp.]|uniref:hypothetical protein n=1 Tax=Halocynthiibacter sp. TaxID=1979210 RepID=UPI003C37D266